MSMLARFATTGGGVATYIEDVFSTYLYTGNGSTQTITNGIDLAGKGGLVWLKRRPNVDSHILTDSARGFGTTAPRLATDSTSVSLGTLDISAQSSGFILTGGGGSFNSSGETYVSWTFREQAKFFDVVTYTGNATSGRAIAHSLGSTPGCVIVKCTTNTYDWMVYHRSLPSSSYFLKLNTTGAQVNVSSIWSTTAPTATDFYVGSDGSTNGSGETYVAYIFAHDAGGFGASGSDNVISCGSVTANGSGAVAETNLGWEPQWVLYKRTDSTSNWFLFDTMRGLVTGTSPTSTDNRALYPNLSDAEISSGSLFQPLATGFAAETAAANSTWIYIAIRRGPMKTPTTGTSVYNAGARSDGVGGATITSTSATSYIGSVDLAVFANRAGNAKNFQFADKLRGFQQTTGPAADTLTTPTLSTSSDSVDATSGNAIFVTPGAEVRFSSDSVGAKIGYAFARAPGFFDVVCYTGDGTSGSGRAITHNLGVAPELVIVKSRSNTYAWRVWQTSFGTTYNALLNTNAAQNTDFYLWANTYLAVTNPATQFGVYGDGTTNSTNTNAATYVAYLFATVPGVSKVFSYTGNGSSQTINCGFTGGARFVLIKRTDSTGDWYVWDSARGIVAGNDPHLSLNSTAAEVTTDDSVDTDSTGFIVNQLAATNVNVNAATYIGLAIA